MKVKTILALQKVSVIFLVVMFGVIFQFKAFGQDLSPAQKGVWQMVESYWNTWKEKTSEKLRPFYQIPIGTPIVAVSDGIIVFIGAEYKDKIFGGGVAVVLKHANDFFSLYAHLSEIYVSNEQHIKRGERLGLSGQSNDGSPHLHFGLIKNTEKGSGLYFSQSHNPNDFWLDGKPQCYDPHKDYSQNTSKEITFPVLCSESF